MDTIGKRHACFPLAMILFSDAIGLERRPPAETLLPIMLSIAVNPRRIFVAHGVDTGGSITLSAVRSPHTIIFPTSFPHKAKHAQFSHSYPFDVFHHLFLPSCPLPTPLLLLLLPSRTARLLRLLSITRDQIQKTLFLLLLG